MTFEIDKHLENKFKDLPLDKLQNFEDWKKAYIAEVMSDPSKDKELSFLLKQEQMYNNLKDVDLSKDSKLYNLLEALEADSLMQPYTSKDFKEDIKELARFEAVSALLDEDANKNYTQEDLENKYKEVLSQTIVGTCLSQFAYDQAIKKSTSGLDIQAAAFCEGIANGSGEKINISQHVATATIAQKVTWVDKLAQKIGAEEILHKVRKFDEKATKKFGPYYKFAKTTVVGIAAVGAASIAATSLGFASTAGVAAYSVAMTAKAISSSVKSFNNKKKKGKADGNWFSHIIKKENRSELVGLGVSVAGSAISCYLGAGSDVDGEKTSRIAKSAIAAIGIANTFIASNIAAIKEPDVKKRKAMRKDARITAKLGLASVAAIMATGCADKDAETTTTTTTTAQTEATITTEQTTGNQAQAEAAAVNVVDVVNEDFNALDKETVAQMDTEDKAFQKDLDAEAKLMLDEENNIAAEIKVPEEYDASMGISENQHEQLKSYLGKDYDEYYKKIDAEFMKAFEGHTREEILFEFSKLEQWTGGGKYHHIETFDSLEKFFDGDGDLTPEELKGIRASFDTIDEDGDYSGKGAEKKYNVRAVGRDTLETDTDGTKVITESTESKAKIDLDAPEDAGETNDDKDKDKDADKNNNGYEKTGNKAIDRAVAKYAEAEQKLAGLYDEEGNPKEDVSKKDIEKAEKKLERREAALKRISEREFVQYNEDVRELDNGGDKGVKERIDRLNEKLKEGELSDERKERIGDRVEELKTRTHSGVGQEADKVADIMNKIAQSKTERNQ